MQEFPLRIPQEFPMRIPEELSYKHQCRASSRSECKDLLLVRILQDLDTISSQEPPTRVFIKAPLRYGICKLLMQGPYREDLTRISTRSSDKDLCDIMEGGSSQYLLPMASTRPRSGSACITDL
jgi:hypothetical protein